MYKTYDAIFFPFIGKRSVGLMVLAIAAVLVLILLFLPNDADLSWIYLIPDARAMSQRSSFPSPLALAYSCAIYGGLVSAIIASFARGDLNALSNVRQKHSPSWRVLGNIFFVCFLLMLLNSEFSNYATTVLRIDIAISTNKLYALMWIEGIFGFLFAGALVLFFDIADILRKIYSYK